MTTVPCAGQCSANNTLSTVGIEWPRIRVREARVRTEDDIMPAYVAQPRNGDHLPVVVLIHGIYGITRYIREVAHRLANHGYLTVTPDLLVRQGDSSIFEAETDLEEKLIARVPDEQVLGDLDSALSWAASNGGDIKHLAATGFGWGGRIAWLYAAHQPRLKAAAAWYAKLDGTRRPTTPQHPIDLVTRLQAPVLGLLAGQDTADALATAAKFQAALAASGGASCLCEYADAPRGFHSHFRPTFREEAAEEGWTRMLGWFEQHGVSQKP